jgi:hypothetical protein
LFVSRCHVSANKPSMVIHRREKMSGKKKKEEKKEGGYVQVARSKGYGQQ